MGEDKDPDEGVLFGMRTWSRGGQATPSKSRVVSALRPELRP